LSYKILGLCRGNGKGYVKILTEGVAAGRLYATATAENGTTLACAAYEMTAAARIAMWRFVRALCLREAGEG
jgi:hypothetical protein